MLSHNVVALIAIQTSLLPWQRMQNVLQKELAANDGNRNGPEDNKPDTMESFRSYHSHLNAPKTGKKKRKVKWQLD